MDKSNPASALSGPEIRFDLGLACSQSISCQPKGSPFPGEEPSHCRLDPPSKFPVSFGSCISRRGGGSWRVVGPLPAHCPGSWLPTVEVAAALAWAVVPSLVWVGRGLTQVWREKRAGNGSRWSNVELEGARCCARPWVKSLYRWSEMVDRPVHPRTIDLPPRQTLTGQPLCSDKIPFLSFTFSLASNICPLPNSLLA